MSDETGNPISSFDREDQRAAFERGAEAMREEARKAYCRWCYECPDAGTYMVGPQIYHKTPRFGPQPCGAMLLCYLPIPEDKADG